MQWEEQRYGGGVRAVLGKTLIVGVYWDSLSPKGDPNSGGYNIVVGNRRLKDKIQDIDQAKAKAIMLAERVLADCQNDLNALKGS